MENSSDDLAILFDLRNFFLNLFLAGIILPFETSLGKSLLFGFGPLFFLGKNITHKNKFQDLGLIKAKKRGSKPKMRQRGGTKNYPSYILQKPSQEKARRGDQKPKISSIPKTILE